MMQLRPGNAQWIGRREDQEDAFGFAGCAPDGGQDGGLVVLADGIGGLPQGGMASRLAVERVLAAYEGRHPDESPPATLRRALGAANQAVYDLACRGGGEMGTTLVAALVQGEHLYWVSVGDSRLYLYRGADGSIIQCTQDHNYRGELLAQVAQGTLTREAAATTPDGDALTSFVGMAEIALVDCNLRPLTLVPGDRVLLCSDGVYGVLSADEMAAALGQEAQAGAAALIAAVKAKALDRQDNATAALMACGPEPAQEPGEAPTRSVAKPRRWWLALLLGFLVTLGLGIWLGHHLDHIGLLWRR
jgi:serine/threonine protein phosphatase PrpC